MEDSEGQHVGPGFKKLKSAAAGEFMPEVAGDRKRLGQLVWNGMVSTYCVLRGAIVNRTKYC